MIFVQWSITGRHRNTQMAASNTKTARKCVWKKFKMVFLLFKHKTVLLPAGVRIQMKVKAPTTKVSIRGNITLLTWAIILWGTQWKLVNVCWAIFYVQQKPKIELSSNNATYLSGVCRWCEEVSCSSAFIHNTEPAHIGGHNIQLLWLVFDGTLFRP